MNFDTSLNISGTYVNKNFSIQINGGFDSLTWTEIKDNSATATRYGVKKSDDNSIVLDTVDTEQNGQTFTLTGITSTEGITFDGKTITVRANNINNETKTVTTNNYELAVTGKDAAQNLGGLNIIETESGFTVTYTTGYGYGYYVKDNEIVLNTEAEMNAKTLLTIDGLIGDEEYIKSGNFIDNSTKTVYLDSQYVDRYNEVTIANNGGYKIDLQNSWTDKKINYIVTDNATISVDGFTDRLNLNLLNEERKTLTYLNTSNSTDNILNLSNGKEITLQGTVTNSTQLNLNTDTVPSIGLSLSKDAQGNYLISSAADLTTLATYVNKGNNCKNLSFKLTNDIDLSSIANWTPIGTSGIAFRGTFNGDDKTISGLNINSSNNYAGLFGHLGKDGTVNNVKLAAVNITANKYVGGLVGYNDCGDINNSSVSGTVGSNGGSRIGGLVGYNHGGTISESSFSGTVNSNGGNYVGGICLAGKPKKSCSKVTSSPARQLPLSQALNMSAALSAQTTATSKTAR